MADVLTSQAEVNLSFPILKFDRNEDGDLVVYGKVTDGTIDSDEQIVDPDWSAKALQDWLSTGANLRVQHNPQRDPAGVGLTVDIDRDGDKAHWLKALVVEPVAKRLVEKGALRAFSVGIMRPKIFTHAKARGGMIGGGDLGEVSLVDRPANKNCIFSLVKADKSGIPEWVGKMEGDKAVIEKMLKPDPRDVAKAISNGHAKMPVPEQGSIPGNGFFADPIANRLAQAMAADAAAEKRDVSTAERQSLAGRGAALPDGSFPIANVSDLKNAIQAIGRAKDRSRAMAHIRRRASALGATNLIPDNWKGLVADDAPDVIGKALADGTMTASQARDELGLTQFMEDVVKGSGKCPTCKGDGKIRGGSMKCPDCGGKGVLGAQKSDGERTSLADSNMDGDYGSDDDQSPDGSRRRKRMRKNWACSQCGTRADKSAAFCPGCGAEFSAKGRVPSDGVQDKKTMPVPSRHREPDGPQTEIFEQDAGLTEGDEGREGTAEPAPTWQGAGSRKKPVRSGSAVFGPVGQDGDTLKSAPAPYAMLRAHDAFCPVYDFADVLAEYPSLTSVTDAISSREIQEAALKAVGAGDLQLGEQLLRVARSADELKAADAGLVLDARAELHKDFTSMYPSVSLTPTCPSPSQMRRGYITAGHATASPDTKPGQGTPLPPGPADASQFRHDYLAAGRARNSPGTIDDGAARPSKPGTGFSRGTAKESAARDLQLIHDHISATFPDLCPLTPLHAETEMPSPLAKGKGKPAFLMPPKKKPKKVKPAAMQPPQKPPAASGADKGLDAAQAKLDAAARSLSELAQGFLDMRESDQARKAEAEAARGAEAEAAAQAAELRKAAAQLAGVAASLSEKSAEGRVSSAEAGELREQIAGLQRLITAESVKAQDDVAGKGLRTAAAKLEKAAAALTAPAVQQDHSSPDMAVLRGQVAELQGMLRGAQAAAAAAAPASTGSDGAANAAYQVEKAISDAKIERLQEQLSAIGMKLEHRDIAAVPAPSPAPDALAKAAEQLAKAASALTETQAAHNMPQPQQWLPPRGWDMPHDGSIASLAGKVERVHDQLAALVAASQNGGPQSRDLGPAEVTLKAMTDQLGKVSEELAAMRSAAADSSARAEAAVAKAASELRQQPQPSPVPAGLEEMWALKANIARLEDQVRKQRKDKRRSERMALKEAVASVTKAAAVLQERPGEVLSPLLEAKADASDVNVITQKLGELQELVGKIGSQPDPYQAPVRGINVNGAGTAPGGATPVERRSLVDEAVRQNRDEKYEFLKSLSASGDPQVREQAQAQINKMLFADANVR